MAMPNINVYLSAPLGARLDQYKDRIKISEVCQAALEFAIEAEEEADRGNRLPRIISRLQSALSPRAAARMAAFEVGRDWAERTATMDELRHVAELREVACTMFADADSLVDYASGGVGIRWMDEMGEQGERYVLPDSIPRDFFPESATSGFFDASVQGFVEGATKLWGDVQAELKRRERPIPASPDA
jgi:hypothetical protein